MMFANNNNIPNVGDYEITFSTSGFRLSMIEEYHVDDDSYISTSNFDGSAASTVDIYNIFQDFGIEHRESDNSPEIYNNLLQEWPETMSFNSAQYLSATTLEELYDLLRQRLNTLQVSATDVRVYNPDVIQTFTLS